MKNEYFTYTDSEMRRLIARIHPRLVAYIRRILNGKVSSYEAEDILQDSLCQFMERKEPILAINVPSYLFRMVRNATLCVLTRNRIDKNSVKIENLSASALERLMQIECEEEYTPRPLDTFSIDEIVDYSNSFTPRMREIFYLTRIEGFTQRQVAEKLGISTRTVEKCLSRSVSLFRKEFNYDNDSSKMS